MILQFLNRLDYFRKMKRIWACLVPGSETQQTQQSAHIYNPNLSGAMSTEHIIHTVQCTVHHNVAMEDDGTIHKKY
jgi:hypothetical protein